MPNSGGITEPAFTSMPHAVPGVDLLFGAMVASGASLRWFLDQFGQLEVQEATQQQIAILEKLPKPEGDCQEREVSTDSRGSRTSVLWAKFK